MMLKSNRSKAKQVLIFLIMIVLSGISIGYWFKNKEEDQLLREINLDQSSDIVFGDVQSKNNIIVFFDYNCKYCRQFIQETYPILSDTILKKTNTKITLRLVCRTTDTKAAEAYQTAMCLNQMGDYYKLHRLLMHKPEVIYTDYFRQIKEDYIMANDVLAECIITSENQNVRRNIYQFQQLETSGTPTFLIGTKVVSGLRKIEYLKSIIESEFN